MKNKEKTIKTFKNLRTVFEFASRIDLNGLKTYKRLWLERRLWIDYKNHNFQLSLLINIEWASIENRFNTSAKSLSGWLVAYYAFYSKVESENPKFEFLIIHSLISCVDRLATANRTRIFSIFCRLLAPISISI